MKKRVLAAVLLVMMLALTACNRKLKISFDYDSSNYVTKLGNYKGVKYTPDNREVTEEDIQAHIDNMKERETVWLPNTTEKIALGDKVVITFSATDVESGKYLIDFSSNENYNLVLGSGTMSKKLEGFEEGIVGAYPGFSKQMVCKVLPDETSMIQEGYSDYVGKEIKCVVTIISAYKGILPSLTNEFIESITDGRYHDEASYRGWVRRYLTNKLEDEKYEARYDEIMDAILAETEVSGYPEAILAQKIEAISDSMNTYSALHGMEPEEYCQKMFNCSIREYCENLIKVDMIYQEIINKEKLYVTDREYDKNLEQFAKDHNYLSSEALLAEQDKDTIVKAMVYQKAKDLIYNSSVPKE